MAKRTAAAPGSDAPKTRTFPTSASLFGTTRSIIWFTLFALWLCVTIAELGLVSQQIHNYGGQNINDWPSSEYGNAMGLLLFASIISLIFGLFHWALGLRLYLVIFIAEGVFWGTGAGILYKSPFGHGLTCGNPVSSFDAIWQPYVSQCSRWTAIEGLAWSMFALAVFGLFFSFVDQFDLHTSRHAVYDVEQAHEQIPEKNNRNSESSS